MGQRKWDGVTTIVAVDLARCRGGEEEWDGAQKGEEGLHRAVGNDMRMDLRKGRFVEKD